MIRVVLESPLRGRAGVADLEAEMEANLIYARRCLADSLARGEAPIASHLLYPQVLDDTNPAQRARGIAAGHAWIANGHLMAVYCDRGISEGMLTGIDLADSKMLRIDFRALDDPAYRLILRAAVVLADRPLRERMPGAVARWLMRAIEADLFNREAVEHHPADCDCHVCGPNLPAALAGDEL